MCAAYQARGEPAHHRRTPAQAMALPRKTQSRGCDSGGDCSQVAPGSEINLDGAGHQGAREMRTTLKHIAVKVAGWAFLLLGVVGLFLPVLQGILFLLIGLTLLSAEYVWAHRLLAHLRLRFPGLDLQLRKATHWVGRWRRHPKPGSPEEKGDQDLTGQPPGTTGNEGRDK